MELDDGGVLCVVLLRSAHGGVEQVDLLVDVSAVAAPPRRLQVQAIHRSRRMWGREEEQV